MRSVRTDNARTAAILVAIVLSMPVLSRAQITPAPPATPPATAAPPAAATRPAPSSATLKAEGDVRQAERDRFAAMVKADVGALDKLLAPELSYTHSNAQVQDKGGFIADIKSGNIKYLSIEPNDVNVIVFGNTAVVTGGAAVHVLQNGTDLTIKIRYTNTQINRTGSWQMVAWEATRLPAITQ
jgi:hypothetical protein